MKRYLREGGLARWYQGFSGPGRPICNDPLSIDIRLRQLEIGRCQFASARCELTSARCELTSPHRQLTSSVYQMRPLGAIDITSMSVAIASAPIDIAPSSIDVALMSIPFTRCEFTSPRCQLPSARCSRPSSVCRLAFVLRIWHLRAGARRTAAATGKWVHSFSPSQGGLVCRSFPEPRPTSPRWRWW